MSDELNSLRPTVQGDAATSTQNLAVFCKAPEDRILENDSRTDLIRMPENSDYTQLLERRKKIEAGIFGRAKIMPSGCWEWQAATPNGYGSVKMFGQNLKVHVLIYATLNGPVSEGCMVCHTCDNPKCVNPLHLAEGTASANLSDAIKKGRRDGPNVATPKDTREKIREHEAAGRSARWIAQELRLKLKTVEHIVTKIRKGKRE